MFQISAIPALQDNYIWAIHNAGSAVVVDPGEASPVLEFLARHGLKLDAILCTHRHRDHIGGIAELRGVYNVPVYGRSHPQNPHVTHDLREGDWLALPQFGIRFEIMELPGHLEDHIAYAAPGQVFCGDILFGAGCGRNFEGTPEQLFHSLQRLAAMPDDTLVYPAHEYTEFNLPFAAVCEPGNQAIRRRIEETRQLLRAGRPTVPCTLALEKATNPFLRCTEPELVRTLRGKGLADTNELAVFAALREWRDRF